MKIAAPLKANPIASIINNSISTAKFPSYCKHAEIGPIDEKDELLFKKTYVPVSILTDISKIIEKKCMNIQMSPFQNEVLKPFISAYRKYCPHETM